MLKGATNVTKLQFAVTLSFTLCRNLIDEFDGLLPRQPGNQGMAFHSRLLPGRQQCIDVFQRLKALHGPLKVMDIDFSARTGSEPSARIHQVLEFHVTGEKPDASADLIFDPGLVAGENQTPYGYRHNDFSAQAAIALAKDMLVNEPSENDAESDDAGSGSDDDEERAERIRRNAVILDIPDEYDDVEEVDRLDQVRLWREGCWFTDYFRPKDEGRVMLEKWR
jgi:hypothetical protein